MPHGRLVPRRSLRRALLAALALGATACGSSAQPPDAAAAPARADSPAPPPAPPPNPFAGPDSARVRAGVDSVFARFDRPGSPGCVVTVMRAGEIAYSRGYGMADLERGTPLTPGHSFDGASMVKQFLAFSVVLLALDGKLSLDDPVHRHLPDLPDHGAPITLRHLVHHTSGLRDWDATWLSGRRDLHPSTLRGLSFAPGTDHMYDDTGYGLLEDVVARITGAPWAHFARRRIYEPLGMAHTGVPPGASGPPRAKGYAPREGGGYRRSGAPDGGFNVTAADLAKWDRNFYDARVGGPEAIRMMTAEGRLNDGETVPYAMALHTEPYRGLRRYWHGGLAGGYRSQFMRYPDQRTSVLVQCNVYQEAEPNALAERVTDVVLADAIARAEGDEPAPRPDPAALAGLDRLAGIYLNHEVQAFRPVRFQEGRLEMRQWITWHPLRPLGEGRFRVEGQPLTVVFRPRADGGAGTLEERWDGRRSVLVHQAVPETPLSPSALAAYTGRFESEELGATWTIAREGEELRVTTGGRVLVRLHPAGPDAFTDRQYVLVLFRRDAAGRIEGFTTATPRVRRIQFAKRG